MPTRLAVGLGPESDPLTLSSTAPRPGLLREFGSPALACRKADQLRLAKRICYHTFEKLQHCWGAPNRVEFGACDWECCRALTRRIWILCSGWGCAVLNGYASR